MKVSVLMLAYNHEKYIVQAVESALLQETTFDYEIVIAEDCSTDRTREILVEYRNRYPDVIRLFLAETNKGAKANIQLLLNACQGEYVALLEGDDYWTSPHKLQKQVELLDSHPEFALCFHPAWKIYENGDREPEVYPSSTKSLYQLTDLIKGNFIPTCSTLFRRGLFGELPEWYFNVPIGDWPLHILNAQHGEIGCIDDIMGVYRIHDEGVTSMRTPAQHIKVYIDFYEAINVHLNFKYDRIINRSFPKHWDVTGEKVVEIGLREGSAEEAQMTVESILEDWPEDILIAEAWKSKVWGKLYLNFALEARNSGDLVATRSNLVQSLRCDPYLLFNLGVWSVGMELLLGRRAIVSLRSILRKAKGLVVKDGDGQPGERNGVEARF